MGDSTGEFKATFHKRLYRGFYEGIYGEFYEGF